MCLSPPFFHADFTFLATSFGLAFYFNSVANFCVFLRMCLMQYRDYFCLPFQYLISLLTGTAEALCTRFFQLLAIIQIQSKIHSTVYCLVPLSLAMLHVHMSFYSFLHVLASHASSLYNIAGTTDNFL